MSASIVCYILFAVVLCTIHLCLGVCIGGTVEGNRNRELLPKLDAATARCRTQLAESIALANQARELVAAICSDRHVSSSIIAQASAFSQKSATLQANMESLSQVMGTIQPNRKKQNQVCNLQRAATSPSLAPPAPPTPSQSGPELVNPDTEAKPLLPAFRYQVWQYVAPKVGEALPTPEQFERVLCRNLSNGGLSFFSPELPPSDLIVSLGTPPDLGFFVVERSSSSPFSLNGEHGYLVECRFVRRLLQIYQWDEEREKIVSACTMGNEVLQEAN